MSFRVIGRTREVDLYHCNFVFHDSYNISPIFDKADFKMYGPLEEAKLRTVHYIPTMNSERRLGMAGCYTGQFGSS